MIVHLTSAHPRYDTRIFIKQCSSLAKIYNTSLIVADGLGSEIKNNVRIIDIGSFNGRKNRILKAPRAILKEALKLDGDIFHLHDPELLPIGLKLKKLGKKVIFDAHEDLPNQILSKYYLNKTTRNSLSFLMKYYEAFSCSKLDGIVAATSFIENKFLNINPNTININNYPKTQEFVVSSSVVKVPNQVCYVGGLAEVRGIKQMTKALSLTKEKATLKIAGDFENPSLEKSIKSMSGWSKVDFIGYVGRDTVQRTLLNSIAGLVVLHPTRSYVNALPVKMFEYMAAGIPVIASNFPLWESIIKDSNCGICVNPLDPYEIAEAIDFLIKHPHKAKQMGNNGQGAIHEHFNWNNEEAKLFDFYHNLLSI